MKIRKDSIYLDVKDKEEIDKAINELFTYFGKDKRRNSIKVLLSDSTSGIIYRKELYPLADSLNSKGGFGSSTGMTPPGNSDFSKFIFFLRYRCPQKGCDYAREVLNFLPAPTCKLHAIEMQRI